MPKLKFQIKPKIKNPKLKLLTFGLIVLFVIWILSFGFYMPVLAAHGDYIVPCGFDVEEGVPCTPCHLWVLSSNIVNFLLFHLALPILAVAILAGGIVWLTSSGNPKQIELGKNILTSSIIGILIAFGGWLIVDTIIKTLGAGELRWSWQEVASCPAPTPPPPSGTPPPITVTPPAGTFQTEAEARAFFARLGIPTKNPCPAGQTKGCVNLTGLPKSTAQTLETMWINGARFRISAGTEPGHATHGIGKTAADIVPLKSSPTKQDFNLLLNQAIPFFGVARCEAEGGAHIRDCAVPSTNHVHVGSR